MAYSDLLERCDWYQSFDNTATPSTSLSYVTRTTANSGGNTRTPRTYSADVPFGSGYSMTLPVANSPESEDITDITNAYAKPVSDTYVNGTTFEFWIKFPTNSSGYDQELLSWPDMASPTYSKYLYLKTNNAIQLTGNFLDGSPSTTNTITTSSLSTDTWHHVSLVSKYDWSYVNASDQHRSVGIFIYVDGVLLTSYNSALQAPSALIGDYFGGESLKSYPRGFAFGGIYGTDGLGAFSGNITLSGIKISNVAYWAHSAQTQKQIARRYMYGKTKNSQTAIATANSPFCYNTLNAYDAGANRFTDYIGTNDIFTGLYNTAATASIDTGNMSGLNKRCISTTGKSFTYDASGSLLFGSPGADITAIKTVLDSYNFTIEEWVKYDLTKYNNFRTSLGGTKPLFTIFGTSGTAVLAWRLNASGQIEATYRLSNLGTNNLTTLVNVGESQPYMQGKLTDGDWHHFALTSEFTGTAVNIKLYIDGNLCAQGSVNTTSPANTGANNLSPDGDCIVSYASSAAQFVGTKTDCIGVYPTTLTQSQIADRYRAYVATGAIITKAYDGTNWNLTTQQKVFNGTDWIQWQEQTLKKWDGSAWVVI